MRKRFANEVNDGNNDYYQKRIEEDYFKGYASLVKAKEVKTPFIVNENTCLLDNNYEWLELYPDNENYAITIMFDDKKNLIEWYFDIAREIGIENNIPYEDDLYLDLLILPNGKHLILDEDELKDAYNKKYITKEEFEIAYKTIDIIKDKYVNNLDDLISLTNKIYNMFN